MTEPTARAVRFDRYGDRDALYVADIAMPSPGPDEVVVEVRAAAINPGEAKIRAGDLREIFPSTFPSGQGSDLAGVIVACGDGVSEFAVGDEVLGYSFTRSSHASHVAVPASQLIRKPAELPWAVAGALYAVGCTACAAARAVAAGPGDTIAVSAAAGGVGSVLVQLLAYRGVSTILGIAAPTNDPWLIAHGVTPVPYGDGLRERLAAAAPGGIDAFIDLFGPDYVKLAVDLGIALDRINTITAFEKAHELGTKAEGSTDASTREVLTEMAGLVATGKIELPIVATYPLEQVADAFAELEQQHTHGKIVLIP